MAAQGTLQAAAGSHHRRRQKALHRSQEECQGDQVCTKTISLDPRLLPHTRTCMGTRLDTANTAIEPLVYSVLSFAFTPKFSHHIYTCKYIHRVLSFEWLFVCLCRMSECCFTTMGTGSPSPLRTERSGSSTR